ncbi:hypothetical protein [Streptomyces sp. cg35]|uniref:hypothetical protein n=1 Tax=Streptomyces sp. cg35 TaxID=3421650 RepID=UPI003D185893
MEDQGAPYWDNGPADPPFLLAISDQELTVPRVDTGWWLGALADGDWATVVRLIDEHNDRTLTELVADEEWDTDDLHRLGCAVAETVAGCPWPMAVRLAQHATSVPWIDFAAPMFSLAPDLDPMNAPLRQVLAGLWALLLQGAEKDADRTRLRAQYTAADGTNAPPNPKSAKGAPTMSGSKYRRFSDAEAAAAFRVAATEKVG